MRKLLPLLWCVTAVAADITQLQQFTQRHRFFDLRNALQELGSDSAEMLFYKAVLASRFGHEAEGAELLQKVFAAEPDERMKRATHEEMASALEILGKAINLQKVPLAEAPTSDGRYRDGVIGMDALWSGFRLDFEAMRLELE